MTVDSLQKHRERSLAARAFSATAGSVSILEEALSYLCVADKPNVEHSKRNLLYSIHSEAPSHNYCRPAVRCAQGSLEVPGVIESANVADFNMVRRCCP